jgi:hypothetical protein
MDPRRSIALMQSGFFVATGLWPIVHPSSFLAVTGPKRDIWLVKTFGALVAAVGVGLAAGARRDVKDETAVLGSKVYLLDAVVEGALLAAWLVLSARRKREAATDSAAPCPAGV